SGHGRREERPIEETGKLQCNSILTCLQQGREYMQMTSTPKKTLLVVWHSRTGAARQMAMAGVRGANDIANELQATDQLNVIVKTAHETSTLDLLAADAYLFCAPEN